MVEPGGPDCNGTAVERTAWLMGTSLRASVCATSRVVGVAAIEEAFVRVREVEARLSTWRHDSELSRLNATPPGRWVSLSPETAELLAEVREWVRLTGGAFDPAVGAAIDAWDLRGEGRVPDAAGVAGPDAWELDATDRRVRRAPGVRLDAGAFGKGAALRTAMAAMRESAAAGLEEGETAGLEWALLDFGGQLLLWSRDPAVRWRLAVADPVERERPAVVMRVGAGSVATTAASERFVSTPDGPAGHVIDPRAGRPVPAWGSVTVVVDDPLAADVLSTALFVMGREAALAWGRASAQAAVLVLEIGEEGSRLYHDDGLGATASGEFSTLE